ncbi:MAG: KH domain-containing protein [Gaiellales bacterium]
MPEELVAYLVRLLVDHPDDVRVERAERDGAVVLELHVAPDDRGQVIGRQGRLIRSLRTVVRATGTKSGERRLLELAE